MRFFPLTRWPHYTGDPGLRPRLGCVVTQFTEVCQDAARVPRLRPLSDEACRVRNVPTSLCIVTLCVAMACFLFFFILFAGLLTFHIYRYIIVPTAFYTNKASDFPMGLHI